MKSFSVFLENKKIGNESWALNRGEQRAVENATCFFCLLLIAQALDESMDAVIVGNLEIVIY